MFEIFILNFLFLTRNFHLAWDGWSHVSALEHNFNPSAMMIERRRKQGTKKGVSYFFSGHRSVVFLVIFCSIFDWTSAKF
jgi:hypothetical protein